MNQLIDKKEFFTKYNIESKQFDETTLKWVDLQKIYIDYLKEIPKLEASAIYIFNSLMKTSYVHSVRYRVKDAEHLIEKIIRKRIKDPGQIITIDNYKSELTDLIGLRALHLFKEEWHPIHELITTTWERKSQQHITEKVILLIIKRDLKNMVAILKSIHMDIVQFITS